MTSLQRSVHAVFLGKTLLPDWFSSGIQQDAACISLRLQQQFRGQFRGQLYQSQTHRSPSPLQNVLVVKSDSFTAATAHIVNVVNSCFSGAAVVSHVTKGHLHLSLLGDGPSSAVASDGRFLYVHNSAGLHKIGSGFGGTIRGDVYESNADFRPSDKGWLAFARDTLFYRCVDSVSNTLHSVDTETLELKDTYDTEGTSHDLRSTLRIVDSETLE